MKRRIFGLENEYGLTCTLNGERRLSPENVARYLFEKGIPGTRNANVFLENGGRLYLDTGFHPEYATPECDDVADLVSHDKAGERIVEDLRHQAEKRLREDGLAGDILLFKNNTDSTGNSYGCHENYLVSRDVSFQRLAEALIPFFVTRQIFAGAGKVLESPVPAIRDISHDPTLREAIKLKDGRTVTALQLQFEYLECATRYVDSISPCARVRERDPLL